MKKWSIDGSCRLIPLRSEADWLAVRQRIESVESACVPNPWCSWEASFILWKHFHRTRTCWLIEIPTGGKLPAAALWLEDRQRRHGITWKILRSMDSMSMGIPPLLAKPGSEAAAHRVLAAELPLIAEVTGCDLVSLYRIDSRPGFALRNDFISSGIDIRCSEYTRNQVIALDDDPAPYWEQMMTAKTRRNIRIAKRRIIEEHGAPPIHERLSGSREGSAVASRQWGEFLRLREQSWQLAEAGTRHMVDPIVLDGWFNEIAALWERRGFLDLHLMRLGSVYTSALLVLTAGSGSWFTYTYYDNEFAACSPGLIGFVHAIETVHGNGVRQIDLGGEGAPWKNRWATNEVPLLTLEWPLGGWKAGIRTGLRKIRAALR